MTARSRTIWTFIVTSEAVFIAQLDTLVVTTALPAIRQHLHASLTSLEWTVNAYTLTFAVLLMTGATLGERFGRRRMLVIGLAIFTVGSAAAALAPSATALIAARAVQGAGAAIITPLTLTLLSAAVPVAKRGMALGIWGGVAGLAVATGPVVGGAVVQGWSWQTIFWLNVPLGLALIPIAWFKLPESRGSATRLDLPGVALASAGLFGIVLGLIRGNELGWTSTFVVTSIVVGVALVAAFVAWEQRAIEPMLPMRLFRSRGFSFTNLASVLMFFGMFGSIFLLAQYLQTVQHYSPLQAGLRTLPWTGMPMIVAPIAGILADRIGGRPVVATGLFFQAAGLGYMASVVTTDASYAAQLPGLILSGIGMALFFAPASNLVMSSVRSEEQGIASGANNALREVGGALGIAVMASIFSAQGGYESGQSFVDGLRPALVTGAAVVAVAGVAALLIPSRKRAAVVASSERARSLETVSG